MVWRRRLEPEERRRAVEATLGALRAGAGVGCSGDPSDLRALGLGEEMGVPSIRRGPGSECRTFLPRSTWLLRSWASRDGPADGTGRGAEEGRGLGGTALSHRILTEDGPAPEMERVLGVERPLGGRTSLFIRRAAGVFEDSVAPAGERAGMTIVGATRLVRLLVLPAGVEEGA